MRLVDFLSSVPHLENLGLILGHLEDAANIPQFVFHHLKTLRIPSFLTNAQFFSSYMKREEFDALVECRAVFVLIDDDDNTSWGT